MEERGHSPDLKEIILVPVYRRLLRPRKLVPLTLLLDLQGENVSVRRQNSYEQNLSTHNIYIRKVNGGKF